MKRIAILIALVALATNSFAQRYTITGKTNAGAKYAYLQNLEAKQIDSVAVAADGNFKFEGDAKGKHFAAVGDDKTKLPLHLVLEENVSVDLSTATLSGTTENALYNRYQKDIHAELAQLLPAVAYLRANSEKANSAEYEAQMNIYEKSSENLVNTVKRAIKEQPQALFLGSLLMQYGDMLDEADIIALAATDAPCFQTSALKPLKNRLEGIKRRAVGAAFTDLTMADPNGIVKKLSDYCGKGNYVLVDFWASWCGPCRAEMPAVKALYDKYHPKGFDIVGVSFDNDKAAWTGAIKRLNLTWNHISDLKGWKCAATEVYGINSIPATLLLDPEGKIVAFGLRAEGLGEKLKEIYGE